MIKCTWCHRLCDKRWFCDDRWCSECEMWLNGPAQYSEHGRGKKHRKNMKRIASAKAGLVDPPTKMVLPGGTVFIIEQSVLSLGRSVDRSVDGSIGRSIARSLDGSVAPSLCRSVGRPVACSLGRSIARSLDRSIARSLGHSVARSLGPSLGRSMARSLGCSIARSLSRLIARSIVILFESHG